MTVLVIGWARIRFAAAAIVTSAVVYVAYARIALPQLDKMEPGGEYAGPMTQAVKPLETLIPALIGGLLLMAVVYSLIIAPIQRERSVNRRRR